MIHARGELDRSRGEVHTPRLKSSRRTYIGLHGECARVPVWPASCRGSGMGCLLQRVGPRGKASEASDVLQGSGSEGVHLLCIDPRCSYLVPWRSFGFRIKISKLSRGFRRAASAKSAGNTATATRSPANLLPLHLHLYNDARDMYLV